MSTEKKSVNYLLSKDSSSWISWQRCLDQQPLRLSYAKEVKKTRQKNFKTNNSNDDNSTAWNMKHLHDKLLEVVDMAVLQYPSGISNPKGFSGKI